MDRVNRISILLRLTPFCLLLGCSDVVKHKVVLPPSRPVNYSGAAADPDWLQNQERTYSKQGIADPQAELTARLEFERQQSHQEGSISPGAIEIVSELKSEKKESESKTSNNKKKRVQDNSDPNQLFYTPNLPPPEPVKTTPTPAPDYPIIRTIPVAPAVPDDSSQTPGQAN